MGRPAPPSDDGSPARLIAAMVGIVGILLLGSLAWSAVGALVSAVGAAGSALSAANPPPPATLVPAAAATPAPIGSAAPAPTSATLQPGGSTPAAPPPNATPAQPTNATPAQPASATPGAQPANPTLAVATQTLAPPATPIPSPTTVAAGRNPWILLPQPEPGSKVPQGPLTLEARGRGDSPITAMRLELDGSPLATSVEQRSETTWRGSASIKVGAGQHTVRATVTDADGRSGSFRWTFTAAPAP